jgi:hypothetical protein
MRVHDFGLGKTLIYRYRVDIPRENTTSMEIVEKWLEENNIQCSLIPGHVFFRNEQDAMLFVLRWS